MKPLRSIRKLPPRLATIRFKTVYMFRSVTSNSLGILRLLKSRFRKFKICCMSSGGRKSISSALESKLSSCLIEGARDMEDWEWRFGAKACIGATNEEDYCMEDPIGMKDSNVPI